MKLADATVYRCPQTHETLSLDIAEERGGEIVRGTLKAPNGASYAIERGIPDLAYPPVLPDADAFARQIYDSVADVYDEYLPLTFMTFSCKEEDARNHMVDRLRVAPGQTILEVGAGTGRTSKVIADRMHGSGHLYIHDISRGILERAVQKLSSEKIERSYILSNAVYLPFPDSYFDGLFHFGGLNMFSDLRRAMAEMVRVVKPGGRIVVGDESVPPWLRETTFGKILMNSSSHYASSLPLDALPMEARDVVIEYIIGGVFYLISFTVGEGEPVADFDFEIPGARGGTHKTRYYGQLEGVSMEAKELAQRAQKQRGISMHKWLDEAVREAALRDLKK